MKKDLTQISDIAETRLRTLKKYFERREDIAFTFRFGSGSKGRVRKEGDVDLAVYFWPEKGIEWENVKRRYEGKNRIAIDLEKLVKKEVDLIVLNRAKEVLAEEGIKKERPIVMKDRGLFREFLGIISDEAEEMREWIEIEIIVQGSGKVVGDSF